MAALDPSYESALTVDPPLWVITLALLEVPEEVVDQGLRLLAALGPPRTREERQTRERHLGVLFATYHRAEPQKPL